jgi:hypothetical protein
MKFFGLWIFFGLCCQVSCNVSRTKNPSMENRLTSLENKLNSAYSSPTDLINLFSSLKYHYSRFPSLYWDPKGKHINGLAKFRSVLLRYHKLFKETLDKSPLECFRTIRLFGNLELTYFYSFYLTITISDPTLATLKTPLLWIVKKFPDAKGKFKKLAPSILAFYEKFATDILQRPFLAKEQTQEGDIIDSSAKANYNINDDWNLRKETLREIILTFKDLLKTSNDLKANCMEGWEEKIVMYEFLVEKFQVDDQGPSYDGLISTFHLLLFLFDL